MKNPLLYELVSLLKIDPYLTDFDKLVHIIQMINEDTKVDIIKFCERALSNGELLNNRKVRIACSKLLVALCPDSEELIRTMIKTKGEPGFYEILFSLFCFLDQLYELPGCQTLIKDIPSLLAKNIFVLKRDVAQVMFMASDLLGDHWNIEESLPYLVQLATKAKYADARACAVHGLGHIVKRLNESDARTNKIKSVLQGIVLNDRSKSVKISAQMILEGYSL